MTPSGRRYLLFMLMLVYLLSFLDRQIVSILAEDIKRDLLLSDTQLGLLTGLAFAVFYATLGVPVARLAERYDRITILSVCVAIWSAMTAAGALATNFVALALTRAGVGVGEAGSVAPAHSMIADIFPPSQRSQAMAVFQLGVPLGILAGFFIGGVVSDAFGWRVTLVVVGLPGVLLAVVFRMTLKEPRTLGPVDLTPAASTASRASEEQSPPGEAPASFLQTVRVLFAQPGYVFTLLGATCVSAAGYAVLSFLPPFLIRQFAMDTATVGVALAFIIGLGGGVGLYLGGMAADALARRTPAGPLWLCVGSTLLTAPLFAIAFVASDVHTVFWWLIAPSVLNMIWMGPGFAMVQTFAPPRARATAAALVLLSINLVGLGAGPLIIGVASDAFGSAGVDNPLGHALLLAPVMLLFAAISFAIATRFVSRPAALSDTAAA